MTLHLEAKIKRGNGERCCEPVVYHDELAAWLGSSHYFTEVCDGDRAVCLSA